MTNLEEFLHGFTPAQRRAALHTETPLLLLAGAGSGKTKAMIGRMAYLLLPKKLGGLGADPRSIMMVTFTNKAAAEMNERLAPVLEAVHAERDGFKPKPWVGTFHSLCLQILRIESKKANLGSNFSIYDTSDANSIAKDIAKSLEMAEFNVSDFFRDMELAKSRAFTPEFLANMQLELMMHEENPENEGQPLPKRLQAAKVILEQAFKTPDFIQVYAEYQRTLKADNAVDFSDLISRVVLLFREHVDVRRAWQSNLRHLIVDEAQDTNPAQIALLRALFGNGEPFVMPENMKGHDDADPSASQGQHVINTRRVKEFPKPSIAFVGDNDQAVYAFRGAEPGVLHKLAKQYTGTQVQVLDISFRCPASVLTVGDKLVAGNAGGFEKEIRAVNDRAEPVSLQLHETPVDEVNAIAARATRLLADGRNPDEMAVLTRSRAAQKGIAKALRLKGLPVTEGKAGSILDAAEIKDAMAFAGFLTNKSADAYFARIANKPKRGIAGAALKKLRQDISDYEERSGGYRKGLFEQLSEVAHGKIDPESNVSYGSKMVSNFQGLVNLVGAMEADVRDAAHAGEALLLILERSGYLADLRESALLAIGKPDAEYGDLPPRAFVEAMVLDLQDDAENRGEQSQTSDEDKCSRLDQIKAQDLEDTIDTAEGFNEFGRRLGNLALLLDQASQYNSLADFVQQASLEMGASAISSGIRVMTMHGSKGLEWPIVWAPHWMNAIFPNQKSLDAGQGAIEEERRLGYVAATRAQEELTISASKTTFGAPYLFTRERGASPFFNELRNVGPAVTFCEVRDENDPVFRVSQFSLPEIEDDGSRPAILAGEKRAISEKPVELLHRTPTIDLEATKPSRRRAATKTPVETQPSEQEDLFNPANW